MTKTEETPNLLRRAWNWVWKTGGNDANKGNGSTLPSTEPEVPSPSAEPEVPSPSAEPEVPSPSTVPEVPSKVFGPQNDPMGTTPNPTPSAAAGDRAKFESLISSKPVVQPMDTTPANLGNPDTNTTANPHIDIKSVLPVPSDTTPKNPPSRFALPNKIKEEASYFDIFKQFSYQYKEVAAFVFVISLCLVMLMRYLPVHKNDKKSFPMRLYSALGFGAAVASALPFVFLTPLYAAIIGSVVFVICAAGIFYSAQNRAEHISSREAKYGDATSADSAL